MAGTTAAGKQAAQKNLETDAQFYRRIGAKGGAASTTGGFAAGEAGRVRARLYGQIGGRISTRAKVKRTPEQRARIRQRILKDKAYQHLLKVHEEANR